MLSVSVLFVHLLLHFATAEKHQIETMAGGVAAFDYDNDGWEDLYFLNGAPQPGLRKVGGADCNRLYRNVGGTKFEDVTQKAGVCGTGYDMGVAAGDFDNDGFVDLFVAGVRESYLWRNSGDGRFARVPLPVAGWAIGGGWFDYDRDGDLDLFVVRYVVWDPAKEPFCGDKERGFRTYCHPRYYEGLSNVLLRNEGGGKFVDVSAASGIGRHVGKGMAVAFGDYDGDGWIDAMVTNDTEPNFLFRNLGNGTFAETGERAGIAYNDDGRALSSMGADFRDVDNDGREDLFVTALANETFPLYRSLGRGLFQDVTYVTQIGKATMAYSGWGCWIYDFDNDGRKDLFAAWGDVQTNTEQFSSRASKQRNLFLMQRSDGTFAARAEGEAAWHRGAAFADFNHDGAMDVVVTRLGEAPVMIWGKAAGNWVMVQLEGKKSNRQGLGAVVKIGGQVNRATTAVGYASASSARVHFGVGATTVIPEVEITWPSGARQVLREVKAGQVVTVVEP
jgi:enediyne biosynthesis protein E4